MWGPQVRFRERPGGAIPRAYSTRTAGREILRPEAREAVGERDPGRLYESNPNSRQGLCRRQARIRKGG